MQVDVVIYQDEEANDECPHGCWCPVPSSIVGVAVEYFDNSLTERIITEDQKIHVTRKREYYKVIPKIQLEANGDVIVE